MRDVGSGLVRHPYWWVLLLASLLAGTAIKIALPGPWDWSASIFWLLAGYLLLGRSRLIEEKQ